jgi:hypothetical protein
MGASRLFNHDFQSNASLVFDFYDFDMDGIISKNDIIALLSHIPETKLLEEQKLECTKEGQFTQHGGGL